MRKKKRTRSTEISTFSRRSDLSLWSYFYWQNNNNGSMDWL